MKISKFLLLLLIPLLSSFYAHKYYLSVTELAYNEEEKTIQIVTRLFYDDLEAVLQQRYDEHLIVEADADQEKLDRYLSKYLTKKLNIAVNGNMQKINYLGKEYEDDYIVSYMEVASVEGIQSIEIESTLLLDLYEEQKNMIHIEILGKKKSLLFRDGYTKEVLKFSE